MSTTYTELIDCTNNLAVLSQTSPFPLVSYGPEVDILNECLNTPSAKKISASKESSLGKAIREAASELKRLQAEVDQGKPRHETSKSVRDAIATMLKRLEEALPKQSVSKVKKEVQPHDALSDSLQRIQKCEKMVDFLGVYNENTFHDALQQLIKAQGGQDPDEWAKRWAIRMRNPSPEDLLHDRRRKLLLELLYQLCRCLLDERNKSVTEDSIVKRFKAEKIENILSRALPMDRANCLYKMMYPRATWYGMHWVSQKHLEGDSDLATLVESECNGRATMNKQLLRLLEIKNLGLAENSAIVEWLRPFILCRQEREEVVRSSEELSSALVLFFVHSEFALSRAKPNQISLRTKENAEERFTYNDIMSRIASLNKFLDKANQLQPVQTLIAATKAYEEALSKWLHGMAIVEWADASPGHPRWMRANEIVSTIDKIQDCEQEILKGMAEKVVLSPIQPDQYSVLLPLASLFVLLELAAVIYMMPRTIANVQAIFNLLYL